MRGGLGFASAKRLMEIECLSKSKGISNVKIPISSGTFSRSFRLQGQKKIGGFARTLLQTCIPNTGSNT